MIEARCNSCQKRIGVADKHAGKTAKCPNCKQPFKIPEIVYELEEIVEIDDPLLNDPTYADPLANDFNDPFVSDPFGNATSGPIDDPFAAPLPVASHNPHRSHVSVIRPRGAPGLIRGPFGRRSSRRKVNRRPR